MILITENEFKDTKSSTLLPIECLVCRKTFYKDKYYIKSRILNPNNKVTGNCCSPKCAGLKQRNKNIKKKCPKCGKEFETKSGKEERKCCSRKCANSRKWSKDDKLKKSKAAKKSKKAQETCRINFLKAVRPISEKKKILKICPMCKKKFKVLPCQKKNLLFKKML